MRRISSWNSTRYVTGTSFFFTVPAMYSYFKYNMIFPPLLLCTTSIISANYWRDAMDDWRRTLDLYFSKLSFSYFVGCAFYYIPFKENIIVGIPNLLLILYCFHKSDTEHKKKSRSWLYYHIGFHSLITFQLFVIFDYIGKNKLTKNILMPNKI